MENSSATMGAYTNTLFSRSVQYFLPRLLKLREGRADSFLICFGAPLPVGEETPDEYPEEEEDADAALVFRARLLFLGRLLVVEEEEDLAFCFCSAWSPPFSASPSMP